MGEQVVVSIARFTFYFHFYHDDLMFSSLSRSRDGASGVRLMLMLMLMLMLSLLRRRDMRASEPFEPSRYASKRAIEPSRYASERAIEPSQSVVPFFKSEQIGCIAFK